MAALRWGIVGLGLAGRARARAMAEDPRAVPVLGFRGDPAAVGLPVADSLQALLAADIDAVAICAPDRTHPELVAAALEAGKHVLCEFPLAGSAAQAAALFDRAEAAGRVLHVEHIELLGPQAAFVRDHARGRQIQGGSCRFTSRPRTGIFSLAHANIARLHRILDALGPPDDVAVFERDPDSLWAQLSWPGNPEHYTGEARIDLHFKQEEGASRRFEMVLDFAGASLTCLDRTVLVQGLPVALPPGPGLFLADQLEASAEILDGQPPTVGRAAVLRALALADRLDQDPLRPPLPPDQFDLSEFDLDAIEFEAG